MNMSEREFLLMLVDKELEEEYYSCDDKEWIRNLIRAKKWLLDRKRATGIEKLMRSLEISDDIKRYLDKEESC